MDASTADVRSESRPAGELDLLNPAQRDALTQLVCRSYFFANGRSPKPQEVTAIIEAELANATKVRRRTEGGGTFPVAERPSVETGAEKEPRESRPQLTWLTEDELRDAERACLWAGIHGIPRLTEAVTWFAGNRRMAMAPLLPQCMTEFIIAKRCEGLKANSIENYTMYVGEFVKEFADRRPATVAPKEIADYLLRWPNPYTRANRWQVLATFYSWVARQHYVTENPVFLAMRKPRTPPPERRVLTPDAARVVLEVASQTETIAYWCLSLFAGMRTGEIQAMQRLSDPWSAVQFDRGTIDLRDEITKTWPRLIPVRPPLREWLRWIKARDLPFMPRNFHFKCRPVRLELAAVLGPPAGRTDGARDCTVENIGRRTYISCRLAMPGAGYAEVTDEVGNTEEVIRKHYLVRVSRAQAVAYFGLSPKRVLAS